MTTKAYVPSTGDNEGFVALSRSKQGKIYKKHILNKGELLYPAAIGGKILIDDAFFKNMKKNFDAKVCDIVQAPVVGDNNVHSEDPYRNIGEVVDLSMDGEKIYAHIDVRKPEAIEAIDNRVFLGASAMFGTNYVDTRTGKPAPGPTLLHVAITNRPFVVDLEDFDELVAASHVSDDSNTDDVVFLTATSTTKKEAAMPATLDELSASLKADHGIDLADLQARAVKGDEFATLSNKISALAEGSDFVKLSNGEALTADAIASAFEAEQTKIVELSGRVDTLVEEGAKAAAEKRVDELISGGFILPAKRDSMIKLSRSDAELFEELIPEKPLVALSAEEGFLPQDVTQDEVVESEVARLSAVASAQAPTTAVAA